MTTRITVHPSLDASWHPKIERQLNLSLASLHWQFAHLNAELTATSGDNLHQTGYVCRLEADLRSGRKQSVSAISRDASACIIDAAERMRRNITRDKQLGLLGRFS